MKTTKKSYKLLFILQLLFSIIGLIFLAYFVYAIVLNLQTTVDFQGSDYEKLNSEQNALIKKNGIIFLSSLSLFIFSLELTITINIYAAVANYRNQKNKLMILSIAGALVSRFFSLISAIISLKQIKNYDQI